MRASVEDPTAARATAMDPAAECGAVADLAAML